jgi:hypothetical protein
MHHRYALVKVRMGIFFGWPAMGCPARVPDTGAPVKGGIAETVFQIAELALTAAHRNFTFMENSNPC